MVRRFSAAQLRAIADLMESLAAACEHDPAGPGNGAAVLSIGGVTLGVIEDSEAASALVFRPGEEAA